MSKIKYGNIIREPDTWHITALTFDNEAQRFVFILEKGLRVEIFTLPILEAISSGFINIPVLEKYFTK